MDNNDDGPPPLRFRLAMARLLREQEQLEAAEEEARKRTPYARFNSIANDTFSEIVGNHMSKGQQLVFRCISRRFARLVPPTVLPPAIPPLLRPGAADMEVVEEEEHLPNATLCYAVACGSSDLFAWVFRRACASVITPCVLDKAPHDLFPTLVELALRQEFDIKALIRIVVRRGDYKTLMTIDRREAYEGFPGLDRCATAEPTTADHKQILIHLKDNNQSFCPHISLLGPIKRNDLATMGWLKNFAGVELIGDHWDTYSDKLSKTIAKYATVETADWIYHHLSKMSVPINAARYGRIDLVEMYIRRGVTMNKQILLQAAAAGTSVECLRYVAENVDGDVHDPRAVYAETVRNGHGTGLAGIKYLLECGLPWDLRGLLTWTLHGHHPDILSIVTHLLERGAAPRNDHLYQTLERGNTAVAELLVQHSPGLVKNVTRLGLHSADLMDNAEEGLAWFDAHKPDIHIKYVATTWRRPMWRVMAWAYNRGTQVKHRFGAKNDQWVRAVAKFFEDRKLSDASFVTRLVNTKYTTVKTDEWSYHQQHVLRWAAM